MNVLRNVILLPFSLIFNAITKIRNWCFNKGIFISTEFKQPIIVIGNLRVGGTGKTPMAIYLSRYLLSQGLKTALLSRGYGRKTTGFREVFTTDDPELSGDEPLLIRSEIADENFRVFVGEDRVAAIHKINADFQPDIVLLDDAFQHRNLKAGFYILLTEYAQPFYDDYLMPSGMLRESRQGAERATAVIVTKCPDDLHILEKLKVTNHIRKYAGKKPVMFSSIQYAELNHWKGKATKVFAVSAIANPASFESHVNETFTLVGSKHYADHHAFTAADSEAIFNEAIAKEADLVICTSKDYVKLNRLWAQHSDLKLVPLPIEHSMNEADTLLLQEMISNFARN